MTQFNNTIKMEILTSQETYDAFNTFIFSNDTKVLGKLIARSILFNQVISVPGDIVECGVFKGSGIFSWLKLKTILAPNSFKKVIGFDFFNTDELINELSGQDKEAMNELFVSRNFNHTNNYNVILEQILIDAGFTSSDFELISGDVSETSKQFVKDRPGAKISLLYMDVDLEKPTYDTLCALWPKVSKGGIVVLDEYACHQWSESIGVDRFAEEHNLTVEPLDFFAPTAYIKKV